MDHNSDENESSNPRWVMIKQFLENSDPELVPKFKSFANYFTIYCKRISIKHPRLRIGYNDNASLARFWPRSQEAENLSTSLITKNRTATNKELSSPPDKPNNQKVCKKNCFVKLQIVNLEELRERSIRENERVINGRSSSSSSASVSDSETSSDSSSASNSSRSSSSTEDNTSNLENIVFRKRYNNRERSSRSRRKTKVPYLARSKVHLDSNESDSFYDSEIEKDDNDNVNDNDVDVDDDYGDDYMRISNGVISTDSEYESEIIEPARKHVKTSYISNADKEKPVKINGGTNSTSASWRNDPLARMRIDDDSNDSADNTEAVKGSEITRDNNVRETTAKRKHSQSDSDSNSAPHSRRKRIERIYDTSSEEESSSDSIKNNSKENDKENRISDAKGAATDDSRVSATGDAISTATGSKGSTTSATMSGATGDSTSGVTALINFDKSLSASRKNIRKIISNRELDLTTRLVIEAEKKRKERLQQQRLEMQNWLKKYDDPLERNAILEYNNIHKKPMVRIDPYLMPQLKEHQIEGIRFMWESCFESCKLSRTTQGSGCILAHYMGLGKTFQVVALVHALFSQKETQVKRVLVVCPVNLLHSWHTEFVEKFNECKRKIDLRIYKIVSRNAVDHINSWWTYNGVMLVSYEMLSGLFGKTSKKGESSKDLQEVYDKYLMNTDLVICDEGHFIKNIKNIRSKSLLRVKTHRRIILTGTPIQNNLAEYFWMMNFVKPNYLGSFKEFTNRFMNPIRNGQYEDSTKRDITVMKKRSYVLHDMLKETIQRMNYDVLKKYLPSKYDYVLFLQMSHIQRQLYNKFLDLMQSRVEDGKNGTFYSTALFANQQIMRMIWSHPYSLVLRSRDKNPVNFIVEGTEKDESTNITNKIKQDEIIKLLLESVNIDDLDILRNGTKMKILMAIIKETVGLKEKIVVFSSSRLELTCMQHFLEKSRYKNSVDYIRIDGRNTMKDRQRLFTRFCNPQEKKLSILLCSKKVGGIGLTLLPANRVILMDVDWNPAYDQQAVYRVYRFGQTKQSAVYRLVPGHTMEQVIYERSITKMAVSHRVVDNDQISRHFNSSDLERIYQRIPESLVERAPSIPIRESVLIKVVKDNGNIVYQVKDHTSLLENRPDEDLNEEERRLALEEYEKEASDVSKAAQSSNALVNSYKAVLLSLSPPTQNIQSPIPSVSEPLSLDPSPSVTNTAVS